MTQDDPAAPLGYRLGGVWETSAFIGRGPVGEVYACTGKDGKGPFAAKLLPEELLDSSETWSDYLAAVSAVASLQHEAIVRHIAFGSDLQLACPFVVTERVSLPSLAECIARSGPFTPSSWRATLNVLASVLDRAHAAGVAHGRLTPTNVFVSPLDPEHVKISDFGVGIACAGRPGDTWSGGVRGWVGPENERGTTKPSPAVDVYSLGLLTFYALTGRTLFRALDGDRVDEGKLRRELDDPLTSAAAVARKLGVELDPAFDKWFSRTIAPAPVARYSSTRLLGEAFDRLVRRVEASRGKPVDAKPAEPKPAEPKPAQPGAVLARIKTIKAPAELRNSDPRGLTPSSRQRTTAAATALTLESVPVSARQPSFAVEPQPRSSKRTRAPASPEAESAEDPPTLRMTVADLLAGIQPEQAPAPSAEVAPVAEIVTVSLPEPATPAPADPIAAPVHGLTGSAPEARPVALEIPAAPAVAGPLLEAVPRARWRSSAKAGGLAAAIGLVLFGVVIGRSFGASGTERRSAPTTLASQSEVTKCVAPEPPTASAAAPPLPAKALPAAAVAAAGTGAPVVSAAPVPKVVPVASAAAVAPVASAAAAKSVAPASPARVASAAPSATPAARPTPPTNKAPVARPAPVARKSESKKAEPRRARAPAAAKPCGTFINPCK